MLELTGLPLDRIDYIHLNGLDLAITVFKQLREKDCHRGSPNYVDFLTELCFCLQAYIHCHRLIQSAWKSLYFHRRQFNRLEA